MTAPPDPASAPSPEDVAVELMRRYFEDQDAGAPRPLAEYRALYPGHEALVEQTIRLLASRAESADDSGGAPAVGERLGPYRILRELGRGGQGAVYLAEDTRAERQVALKVLLHQGAELSAPAVQRLKREAEAAALVQHPGLCPIFEVDVEARLPFLAMPYIDGRTLASWLLEEEQRSQGPLRDTDSALRLVEELARALHAAHSAGVVHRDVKPANVMVTPEGRAILLDLGVARTESSELTRTGMMVGTLPYMAPEQVDGRSAVDGRSDVYALGVTLFECLTERLPFDEPTEQRLTQAILHAPAPRARSLSSSISRDLDVVVATALEKDPRHRYQSAKALADDLQAVREHRSIEARAPSTVERLSRWCRRNPALAVALIAVFVSLAVGLVTALLLLRDVEAQRSARQQEVVQKQAALDDVQRLADSRRLRVLREEEQDLWPVRIERAEPMAAWLVRADRLLGRREVHRETLERLAAMAEAVQAADEDATTALWHAESLGELMAGLEEFSTLAESVRAREAQARSITRLTLEEPAADWEQAIQRVAADERFGDFELVPRVGLVPLGADPLTGFEEFALWESGTPPERGADGALPIDPEGAAVFVLLPGGSFHMGADAPSEERPLGEPHVDPWARSMARPVRRLELDPFLLSKYELTQGQWERLAGANPAYFQGSVLKQTSERDPCYPMEHVSWEDCDALFARRGLMLPTEAQWEYACRAGSTTIWSYGDDEFDLHGHENLQDEGSARYRRSDDPFLAGLDDGAVTTQFVGSYAPNAFGLHDMHGNVMEWCRDYFGLYSVDPEPGDGLRVLDPVPARVTRGGSFRDLAAAGSSAARHNGPPDIVLPILGVRPGIALD